MTPVSSLVVQWLCQFAFVFLLVWSVVGVAVGAGLLVFTAATIRFLHAANRMVSTRRSLKAMAMPHNIEPTVRKHRHWFAIAFVAIAAYSCYGLIFRLDTAEAVAAFKLRYPPAFVAWGVEMLRWVLVAGSALVAAVGIMLEFSPRVLRKVESGSNRWVSTRQIAVGGETMHMPLDRWVDARPRLAGVLIFIFSLAAALASALMLYQSLRGPR